MARPVAGCYAELLYLSAQALHLELDLLGLHLLGPHSLRTTCYLLLTTDYLLQALHLELESSAAAVELQLSLNWLQLDNQLVVTQQPVLLRPNPAAHARNPCVLHL